jgi:hypothetical protein
MMQLEPVVLLGDSGSTSVGLKAVALVMTDTGNH